MYKLDQLINELCPEGVEYVELGKFASITRGGNFQKKDFTEKGKPCIHYGQIYTKYGLFTKDAISLINEKVFQKQKKAVQNDIIMAVTSENVEDVCKCVAWLGEEEVAISGHTAIIHHSQNAKYLVYYFHSSLFFLHKVKLAHGIKVIEVRPDSLKNIRIPLPPLPVQAEIVRILDSLTELTAELTAELTTELTARRQQYEYYRNRLFTVNDTLWERLGDVAVMKRGDYVTKKSVITGDIPVILGGQEPAYYCNQSNHDGEAIVISRSGAYAGFVSFWNCPIFVTDGFIIEATDVLNLRFLYHYLKNIQQDLHNTKRGGGVPHVRGNEIMNMKIPVPPLSEQKRIVEILDRFDALCNDISIGLRAEIKARQQQYEYYRDKLLTFKEKEVCENE